MHNDQKTQLWIAAGFIALVIAITAIAAFVSNHPASSTSSNFTATQTSPITSSDHAHGKANAKVTIIEYGDFECPACGAYEPLIEQLYQQYQNQVLFVFRNFPLYQIHPFAMISSEAAEAAGLQGQYWQMHDLLYKEQSQWTANTTLSTSDVITKYFDAYATQLGLNVTQFNSDMNSAAVKDKIQNDLNAGNAAQVNHTPTFFINLVQIQNPNSLQEFENDLNAAIASSTGAASAPAQSSSQTGSFQGATSTAK